MNEQQQMLSDMADGLFASMGPTATMADDWQKVEDLAFASLMLPEDAGGFGGTWQDALILFRLAGYHALALPVAEAIVASYLAQGTALSGRGSIASRCTGEIVAECFTGVISGAVASAGADFLAAPAPDGGTMLLATADAKMVPGSNLAGEGRDIWHIENAAIVRKPDDVFALGAFVRIAQCAGALDAALAMSVGYVNERKQFGRALAKFQAVQQSLATFACEAAAANCAAMGVAQALERGAAHFEIAAAKLRVNQAIGVGTSAAHQAHGAIGFTRDYGLHPLTRRLWSARSEFGGDCYWATVLGDAVVKAGADRVWQDMTALTD